MTGVGTVRSDDCSLTVREDQLGLPAGEAMACAVPLVCSDGGALPEIVGDAMTIVVEPAVLVAQDATETPVDAEQPAAVQMTLRVLYALVPSLCNMVAIVIAFAYPISSRIHADIRKAIVQRQAGLPAINPLKPAQTLN